MNSDLTNDEIISFLKEEAEGAGKMWLASWILIIVGVFCMGSFAYGQFQTRDLEVASAQLTEEVQSESLKTIFEVMDTKIDMMELRLRADQDFDLFLGTILLGWGIGTLFTYKRRLRKKKMLLYLAKRVLDDA